MPFKFNPFTTKLDIVETTNPSVVSTLTPDVGGAVSPVAGTINVNGTNGIQTSNGGAGVLVISDTLVSINTVTTIGAVTSTLISIPLAPSQTVTIQCIIAAYETTTPAAFGGQIIGSVYRAGAAAAAALPNPDPFTSETAGIPNSDIGLSASGNNALVTVTGQAGLTLVWRGAAFYITQA